MSGAVDEPTETAACWCGADAPPTGRLPARDPGTGADFTYLACPACGTWRVSPRPTRQAIGGYYPQDYASHAERPNDRAARIKRLVYRAFHAEHGGLGIWRWPLRLLLWPVRGHSVMAFRAIAPRRVFEFGAGAGNDLLLFRTEGWAVEGCEPSAHACALAAGRGITLQCAPAEDAQLAPSSVSAVLLNNVLEHVHDPVAVLGKAHAGLVPGGALVLVVPNHAGPAARLFGAGWPGYDAPRHLWGFSPTALGALLARCGFAPPRVYPMFQGRWAWRDSLQGARDPAPIAPWRRRHAKLLSLALIPFGILAALFGHGDFITVVAIRPPGPDAAGD